MDVGRNVSADRPRTPGRRAKLATIWSDTMQSAFRIRLAFAFAAASAALLTLGGAIGYLIPPH
jgi:hypothetical protein